MKNRERRNETIYISSGENRNFFVSSWFSILISENMGEDKVHFSRQDLKQMIVKNYFAELTSLTCFFHLKNLWYFMILFIRIIEIKL